MGTHDSDEIREGATRAAHCHSRASDHRPYRGSLILAAFLAAIMTAGFSIWAVWVGSTFGSVYCFLAKNRGDLIYIDQPQKSVRDVIVPNRASAVFRLRNLSERRITILGAKVTCGCLQVHDLPTTVELMQDVQLQVDITPTEKDRGQEVSHSAVLYLDTDAPRPLLTLKASFAQ